MGKSTFKTGKPSGRRRDLQSPTASQVLRQLGVIALVIVVWSLLLVGYVSLTGEDAEQGVSQAPTPTMAPVAAATTAATSDEEAAPTATESAEEAPSATPSEEEPVSTATESAEIAPSATPPPEPTEAAPAPESAISFAGEVLPIFNSRCVQCHGESRTRGGLRLDSYQAAMASSESGPSIVPGDAAHSLLVDLIVSGDMPRRGPTLTPAEIQTITDWVNAGAPDN